MDQRLKVPLLVLNLLLARKACTAPTPPPKPDEVKGYEKDKSTREVSWFLPYFMPLRVNSFSLVDLIEIYLILSRSYPNIRIPYLDSIFLPAGSLFPANKISISFLLGSLLLHAGAILRILCYRILGRHFTYQMAILKNHSLITEGPYSIVRHPSYTGMVVFNLGMGIAHVSEGSWMRECLMKSGLTGKAIVIVHIAGLMFLAGKLLVRVPAEDSVLREEFGAEWDRWAKQTSYKLIPWVY